jgi:hypothetical protein
MSNVLMGSISGPYMGYSSFQEYLKAKEAAAPKTTNQGAETKLDTQEKIDEPEGKGTTYPPGDPRNNPEYWENLKKNKEKKPNYLLWGALAIFAFILFKKK